MTLLSDPRKRTSLKLQSNCTFAQPLRRSSISITSTFAKFPLAPPLRGEEDKLPFLIPSLRHKPENQPKRRVYKSASGEVLPRKRRPMNKSMSNNINTNTATPKRPVIVEQRRSVRHSFSAAAEVVEVVSGTRLRMNARVADLSLGGCYLDTINPFAPETRAHLRINIEMPISHVLQR